MAVSPVIVVRDTNRKETAEATISDVETMASHNWIEGRPAILILGVLCHFPT